MCLCFQHWYIELTIVFLKFFSKLFISKNSLRNINKRVTLPERVCRKKSVKNIFHTKILIFWDENVSGQINWETQTKVEMLGDKSVKESTLELKNSAAV